MATNSVDVLAAGVSPPGSLARFADRWIFVFTAALFIAATLGGFVPESIGIVEAVRAGQRPLPPPIVHLHAVLMGSWLLLLLIQSILIATGRQALHRTLGIAALVLVPAMVVAAPAVEVEYRHNIAIVLGSGLPPGVTPAAALVYLRAFRPSLLLWEIRYVIVFPILVGWALWSRRKDPQTHKRLMILATLAPLAAATDRIAAHLGLPGPTPLVQELYPILLVAPLFVYDLTRLRRVPRAYGIWFAVNLPLVVAGHLLAGTPWWVATGQKLLGMPDF